MSTLTRTMSLVLLAFWGLAISHCKLEFVPGFEFLKCCCSSDAAPNKPSDCSQNVCGAVESGAYKAEDQTVSPPMPVLLMAAVLPFIDEVPLGHVANAVSFGPAPPELAHTWQFSFRTALLPRAPSLPA